MPSCESGTKPSMPSPRSTIAPRSNSRLTVPVSSMSGRELVRQQRPRIVGDLLEAEADAAVLLVDRQHHDLDRVTLLQHFARVRDALGPRHVGDVHQTVDALLELDERAEVGQVADLALDAHARRVLLVERQPRIRLDLLEAERDLLVGLVDLEHHRLDDVADVDDLRRVPHVARPRHLGHVDQALDALLELDECAVVGDRDHLALDAVADLVLVLDAFPRIGLELLQAERDALLLRDRSSAPSRAPCRRS